MLKYMILGLAAAVPSVSAADPIAASLSATFGDSTPVVVDVDGATIAFANPSTISVAAASGERVTASAVATVDGDADSSGALAAATTLESNIIASVEYGGNEYESFVTFGPNASDLEAAIDALEEALGVAEGEIADLQAAVAELQTCEELPVEGEATQTIDLGAAGEILIMAEVTGTTVCVL